MALDWLVLGVAIAGALTVVFAATFALGERLFPTRHAPGPAASGEWKRRSEIRAYLDRIDEPYAEDHPVAGESVAFFLPERDVAITFDGQAYFRLERAGYHAVLVEHEMPGRHLGARLPFETPTFETGEDDERRTPDWSADGRSAFDELGLDPDASVAEVRAAYRERVKEVHPDQGGDERAFQRLQEAYAAAREQAAG